MSQPPPEPPREPVFAGMSEDPDSTMDPDSSDSDVILPPSDFVSNTLSQRKGAIPASQRPNSSSLYLKSISDLDSLFV